MNTNTLKLLVAIAFLFSTAGVYAQKAWVVPARFNPTDSVALYVDVSKTDCSRLKDTQDDLFIWSWNPAEPVGGNGQWTASRDELKMTQSADNPNVYFIKIVPNQFYDVASDKQIYDNGFSFLVKKKDGTGEGGGGCDEDKTEDLNVEALPIPGCNTKFCQLPGVIFKDDYCTFIYNLKEEDKASMQESVVGEMNYGMYIRAFTTDGDRITIANYDEVINYPELRMEKDPADGFYKNTFVPEQLFDLAPGKVLEEIQIQVINVNYTGPNDVSDGRHIAPVGCN